MAYNRANIILEVRDAFYEDSADFFTDAKLQRFLKQEIRSLPRKGIYLEELWTTSTVVDQIDYTLPTGTYKVELVERNVGTAAAPDWDEQKGWDQYAGALYLVARPSTIWTMRIHARKAFSDLTDDTTNSDIPDEKMEVVIWGTVVRAYKALMGYLKNAKNWDAIAKPDGVSLTQIQAWLRDAKQEYKELVQSYKTFPKPRDIDLVG